MSRGFRSHPPLQNNHHLIDFHQTMDVYAPSYNEFVSTVLQLDVQNRMAISDTDVASFLSKVFRTVGAMICLFWFFGIAPLEATFTVFTLLLRFYLVRLCVCARCGYVRAP